MTSPDRPDLGGHRRGLLDWLDAPSSQVGLHVLDEANHWQLISYESLATTTLDIVGRLQADGVKPGDVVTLVLQSGPQFAAGFFAVLAAGATASPVAPPLVFQDTAAYDAHLRRVVEVARPRTILTNPDFLPRLQASDAAGMAKAVTVLPPDELRFDSPGRRQHAPERAVLQFTSGSSGPVKGVAIGREALASNVDAIRRWLHADASTACATWLPVHHDMGLIGCMVTPVVNQSDLWIMSPEDFIRTPERWLSCFGQHGARVTALPTFGLDYVVRRVRPEALEGHDFSGWEVAILGAERIEIDSLQAFHELLEPFGFRWKTFTPAYGLAEATLAVTGVPLGQGARSVTVDRRTLRLGQLVTVLPSESRDDESSLSLTGCGVPLEGGAVRIVDDDGNEVEERTLGEIVVAAPSLADGYVDGDGLYAGDTFVDSVLHTGDAGFLEGGELFVVGRLGDSVKLRARMVFAEDLEEIAVKHGGMKPGRVAVLVGALDGQDTVLVIADGRPDDNVEKVVAALRRHAEGMAVVVARGRRCILRTSSGKPRRRVMWQAFVDGTLGVEVVHDTRLPPAVPTPSPA